MRWWHLDTRVAWLLHLFERLERQERRIHASEQA
jgi:hypothetical protein